MNRSGNIWSNSMQKEKTYFLREIKENDIQAILNLQSKILKEHGFNRQWFYPFIEPELSEILSGSSSINIGIYIENQLIAFRTGCFSGKEYEEVTSALGGRYLAEPCFLMNGVFVDREYRGNRLQQQLSEHCIKLCGNRGITTFLSVVHPDNLASIHALRKVGFLEKKRQMLFNGQYDRLILVKERF